MSEKKDIFWRAYIVYFGFVVLLLVVLFQTVSIQMQDGRSDKLSDGNGGDRLATKTVPKESRRGQILDANYTPLVTSVSYFDIYMDPTVVSKEVFAADLNDLCIGLNRMYPNKTASEYQRMIREARARGSRYLSIRKRVTNEERKKIRQLPIFNLGRFKGGIIDNVENVERKLPHGELLRRTLGKIGKKDAEGNFVKYGIEWSFNDYLKGEPGEEVERKLATGWKKMGLVTKEPVEGADIVTTFDMTIQDVAHTELKRQLESQQAERGCVIVMDVKTGYVKAMVNLQRGSDGEYSERHYNHAIGTKEVPGSTFKLASLMALLEDKKVRLSTKVNAKGHYTFFDKTFKDSNPYGYGEISVQTAFEKSSNVFTQIINRAYKKNPSQFIRRLERFGLADKLNISIQGEKAPTLYQPGHRNWSGLSLPSMAIGYEVQQTPLQTLAFYNAVANDGTFMRPQFVKEIYRGNEKVKVFKPEIMINKVCSDMTVKALQKCLKGVMLRGTGKEINSANFSIAGKTGTARILDNNTTMADKKKYQASFVGYFPADEPIYSCIVVVSAPSQSIYGAVVSGSVFNAIANKVYASALKYHKPVNYGKPKKSIPISKDGYTYDLVNSYRLLGVPYAQSEESKWVFTRARSPKVVLEKRYAGKNTVPNVVGMTARDAVYLIERAGMKAIIEGYGSVKTQSLSAGGPAVRGKQMKITLK